VLQQAIKMFDRIPELNRSKFWSLNELVEVCANNWVDAFSKQLIDLIPLIASAKYHENQINH
jgi:hypothetical protein